MKNLNSFLLTFLLTSSFFYFSQGNDNQQWKSNGNIADDNFFFGTKNNHPIKFRTNDIERMRITKNGLIGIGISSPEAKFDVNGDVIFREHVTLKNLGQSNGLNNDILFIDGSGNVTRGGSNSLTTLIGNTLYAEKGCDANYYNHPVWMNGEKKIFTICEDVFVGINNNKPRVHLDVLGTTYSKKLSLGNTNATDIGQKYFHLKTQNDGTNTEKIVQIENSSNEIFSINNQGLISSKGLDNIGNITNIGAFINTGNVTTNGLTTSNGKFNLKSQLAATNTDKIFTLANDDVEDFTVHNNGYTVTSQLNNRDHFQNDGNIVNLGIFTNIGETRLNGEIILKGETISEKKIKIHAYLDDSPEVLFQIENNIKQLMQVDNNGLLKARRIIVNQDAWADFVFEKDYKLPTLYETERYIKENKHLPNIPSEVEVKENGNDLAKMNALLLQKIEELTLHAIQQQKELDEIKRILFENNKK